MSSDHAYKNDGAGVLVIGAGVSGLTSALCLRRKGFQVTVVADRFAPNVTSVVAGALWEWPPAVCGHHQDEVSLQRSKAWCKTSYDIFADLAVEPSTGVFMRPANFYFQHPISQDSIESRKMQELKQKVLGFECGTELMDEAGINPELGFRDAYRHLAPMIDTDVYMGWLLDQVRNAGCRILVSEVNGPLLEQTSELKRRYGVGVIVNCAGLGAGDLTGDAVAPLRGAIMRIRNDGTDFPRITQAHCVSQDGSDSGPGFIFIVPRGNDMLVLGGFAELDEWDVGIGLEYQPISEMHDRCVNFLPILKGAQMDPDEPVRVGLRPFRPNNVRLDCEAGADVVHNYGHGGSGITLSWGCALEVVQQVEILLAERQ